MISSCDIVILSCYTRTFVFFYYGICLFARPCYIADSTLLMEQLLNACVNY